MAFLTYVHPRSSAYIVGDYVEGFTTLDVARVVGGNRDVDIESIGVSSEDKNGVLFTMRLSLEETLNLIAALNEAVDTT